MHRLREELVADIGEAAEGKHHVRDVAALHVDDELARAHSLRATGLLCFQPIFRIQSTSFLMSASGTAGSGGRYFLAMSFRADELLVDAF